MSASNAHAQVDTSCTAAVDVWFLNDESGSVDKGEFDESVAFLRSVAGKFPYDADKGFKGAILSWSNAGEQKLVPSSGLTTDFDNVVAGYQRSFSAGTYAGAALSTVYDYIKDTSFNPDGLTPMKRRDVPQLVVLLTDVDGLDNGGGSLADQRIFESKATAIRNTGAQIVIMLIDDAAGRYSSQRAFKAVMDTAAGGASNVIVGDTYAKIANESGGHIESLTSRVCEVAQELIGAPTLTVSSPASGSVDVAAGSDIVLKFSETVQALTGNILIDDGAGDVRTVAATDTAQVSISGSVVTLDLSDDLKFGHTYSVRMANDVLENVPKVVYAGLGDGDLEFTIVNTTHWADWTSITGAQKSTTSGSYMYNTGASGTVLDPNTGSNVGLTLSGEVAQWSSVNGANWGNAENPSLAYTTAHVSSPETSDMIAQTGHTEPQYQSHRLVFSQQISEVVMGIWSLGGSQSSTLLFDRDFEIVQTESGANGLTRQVTAQGYALVGAGGGSTGGAAGIIQFLEPLTEVNWTVTAPEVYSGFNIAAVTRDAVAAAGAQIPLDAGAPTLVSSVPADDAWGVGLTDTIALTFSEAVSASTGLVKLYASDGTLTETFALGSGNLSSDKKTVTLTPSNPFAAGAGYYVTVDAAAVRDLSGNPFAGFSGSDDLNFETLSLYTSGTHVNGSSSLTLTLPSSVQGNAMEYVALSSSGVTPAVTGASGDIRVTLWVDAGTIRLTQTAGLTAPIGYTSGQWSGAVQMSFEGAAQDVNAALASLGPFGPRGDDQGGVVFVRRIL